MGVCDVPVISNVCDAAGEAAATLVSAPFDWLASTMGQAAGWLIEAMWTVFDSTTLVDVTADGYLDVYNLLFGIGVFIVVLFFCFQLILGLIRREPQALTRAALGAAKAVLGSFLVITVTATALEIVDQLSIGIVQAAGETTATMGDKITLLTAGLTTINVAAPGVGAIVTIFLAGLMICAVAIVWFSLLIRKALILVTVVLAPLALSGASWDVTKGWIGKWVTFLIALIVSKLVLVVVFLVAITQIATPIDAGLTAVTEPIAGIVLLGIAAFAPYMVYRLISFVGFDLYNSMGAEQDAKNAMNRPLPIPTKPGGEGPKKILDSSGASDGDGDGGGSPPAAKPPASTESAGTETATAETGTETAASSGPAAPVVAGVTVAKEAAEAGPEAGNEVGTQADTAAAGAQNNGNTTPNDSSGNGGPDGGGTPPAPSAPMPNTPTEPSAPADPGPAEGKE